MTSALPASTTRLSNANDHTIAEHRTGHTGRLPVWLQAAPYVAGTFTVIYIALGLAWALGTPGNPMAASNYPSSATGLLGGLSARGSGAFLAAAAIVTALIGLGMVLMLRRDVPVGRLGRWLPTASAGGVALLFAVVLPDFRMIATVGYLPVLAVNALAGDPLDVSAVDVLPWPVVNLLLLTVGGLGWAATAIRYYRRVSGACERCGRAASGWTSPVTALRVGRWAVAVAVVIPVGYALTRFAWALGIPLGVSADLLDDLGSFALVGAGLGAFAVLGAVLTLGLVQGWGEIFPRWVPVLCGRRVPIGLAVVPALFVSTIVASAGVMFVRYAVTGQFENQFPGTNADVAAWLPEVFWPIWGAALAVAATAYWLRRRGRCSACCRGGVTTATARGGSALTDPAG